MSCSPRPRPARRLAGVPRRLPWLALVAALGACSGAEGTLGGSTEDPAPTDEPSAGESAEPVEAPAALTSPRIVFTSYRNNGHPDIYIMDPQGKNVARRTSWAGDEVAPAWSYNNKRIAFVRSRLDASNTRHDDIYLMNADGTQKRWARSSPSSFSITDPSWSPDGTYLVVTAWPGGKPYLATMNVATGSMAFVRIGNQIVPGEQPSYDRTGTRILYVGPTGKTVMMLNFKVTMRYQLLSSPTPVGRPAFSPDGQKFAFSRVIDGTNNMEIFVQSLMSTSAKRLTYSSAYDGAPSWSPDGTRIAFESRRSGQVQIWTMPSTGGTPTRITFTSSIEASPAYSH